MLGALVLGGRRRSGSPDLQAVVLCRHGEPDLKPSRYRRICSARLESVSLTYAPQWLLFEGELREGWTLEVSQDGMVLDARAGPAPPSATRFPNCVMLPGLVNAHSHAFQRLLR